MSTALATKKETLPSLAMNEDELMKVLRNSLYPGAQDESIKMAVGYCKAAGLDIMQKPVHLVPIWDSKSGSMRDVVMPGIGLYRTQAARSGAYAGVTEPEFGPDITEKLGGVDIVYPSWCRVTVKRRLSDGTVAEFTAREFWKENYAIKGGKEKSVAPNAMWTKRPYGQLAKVAEAQALRKAFPEFGSQPTAEELDGREIDMGTIDRATGEITPPRALPPCPDAKIDRWFANVTEGKAAADELLAFAKGRHTLSDVQEGRILAFVANSKLPPPLPADTDDFVRDMEKADRVPGQDDE